jgi:hypothetical protein
MHRRKRIVASLLMLALAVGAGVSFGHAQTNDVGTPGTSAEQKLDLTPAQRNAIYASVSKDNSKKSPQRFSTAVGAEVPPMIELYSLPDDVLAANPSAKMFEYTVVQDQVVLVDPTKMRVVEVIGPGPQR